MHLADIATRRYSAEKRKRYGAQAASPRQLPGASRTSTGRARVFVNYAGPSDRASALQGAFAGVVEGDRVRMTRAALKRLLKMTPVTLCAAAADRDENVTRGCYIFLTILAVSARLKGARFHRSRSIVAPLPRLGSSVLLAPAVLRGRCISKPPAEPKVLPSTNRGDRAARTRIRRERRKSVADAAAQDLLRSRTFRSNPDTRCGRAEARASKTNVFEMPTYRPARNRQIRRRRLAGVHAETHGPQADRLRSNSPPEHPLYRVQDLTERG